LNKQSSKHKRDVFGAVRWYRESK